MAKRKVNGVRKIKNIPGGKQKRPKKASPARFRSRPRFFRVGAIFMMLAVFLASSGMGALAMAKYEISKIPIVELAEEEIVTNEGLEKKEPAINDYKLIALFGVDDQDNVITDHSRTDCIIVAAIHNKTHEVKLLSIYRDTFVSQNGEYRKINSAYTNGGPAFALSTLNRNLDLNITDFATVNFKALADCVDIVGGVPLTIETDELKNLNDYIGNMNKINGGHSEKFKEAGSYTFDGNQAVAYARIRYTKGGDHARANRQRLVLSALFSQVKKKPWCLVKLIDVVLPQLKTSLSEEEMMGLFKGLLFYKLPPENMAAYPFDSRDVKYHKYYYGFPLSVKSNVVKAHQYLFDTKDYEPTDELCRIHKKVKKVTDELGL